MTFDEEANSQTTPNFPIVAPDKESIKLVKNTKGYNWEIKVVAEKLGEEEKKRLDELNSWCKDNYGLGDY